MTILKKLWAMLLIALLLIGCVAQSSTETTGPNHTDPTVSVTDPKPTTPAPTVGAPTDPTETQPTDPTAAPTDPTAIPTDPKPTDPTPTEPQPTVAPTEPAPTQPKPTEPAPTEPEPTDPPRCAGHDSDPYVGMTSEEFYADYAPACCYQDACYRTQHYFLSGMLYIPGQYYEPADDRPMTSDGLYIRNTDTLYEDNGNTYIVVDAQGNEVLRVYKGAAYITLEEVAAYMYAFGGNGCVLPANHTSSKNTRPYNSPWGQYLRVNHSKFSGDTSRYPYEPELPYISGCGGDLTYYEMDIGTTGTTTPGYAPYPYNNGSSIERGAARIVYTRQDRNGNGVYENDEVYVFYTFNHYNDFVEYLNYYGGWGQEFGNMTGGGSYSSKYDCNPTPYPQVAFASFCG